MKQIHLWLRLCVLLLACSVLLEAQETGVWSAANSTAKSITGDLSITSSKVFIGFTGFTVAPIRKLQPSEAVSVFGEGNESAKGTIYRLDVPSTKRFLHKNTLCGSEDVQWMVTAVAGHNLQVAFFSGQSIPVLTAEALANSTDLCGTFVYER